MDALQVALVSGAIGFLIGALGTGLKMVNDFGQRIRAVEVQMSIALELLGAKGRV